MMIASKPFYMIRHGETEANAARIMAGSLDSPLTEKGRMQAKRVQPVLGQLAVKPKTIIHSHLSRARDTAAILNEALDVPMVEDPDWAELHAGDWEGQPHEMCKPMNHGWESPPGGETFKEFFMRVRRAKLRALHDFEGPVLVVCHGGVFRAFGGLHGIETFGVRNCHLYEFEPHAQSPSFPWKAWHYEYFDEQTETLLCDCSMEERVPMSRPSTLKKIPLGNAQEITVNIRRTPCDLFHADNISSSVDEIAS